MKLVRIAAATLNQTPLDFTGNLERILDAMQQARSAQVELLCLPELCLTGYGCEDAFMMPAVWRAAWDGLLQVAAESQGMVVSVGLPVQYAGGLFNAVAVVADGRILGLVAKQHLAGDGIHYEPRWFKRWPSAIQAELKVDSQRYPIGDFLFEVDGVRLGFEICEDAWVGTRPGARHAERGADILLNPSASHFAFGKHQIRKRFVLEGSRAFFVTYVYANLVGNEAGRAIYDGDAMIASRGQMLASGPRFSYRDAQLTTATVDIDATRIARAQSGSFEPELDGDEADILQADFRFTPAELSADPLSADAWESSEHLKEEEFSRAVSLGLFDYLRKSRSGGVVVSLSGGADSAAVTVLSRLMLEFGAEQLGWQGLLGKLAYLRPASANLSGLAAELITTAYQSTCNSGEVTRLAAREVADAVGATHHEFDVDSIVRDYSQLVEQAIGRPLSWESDDIALQNIQARVRAPSVWMLANLQRALLLSTSNRSEAAVGYATMDGDTSGGLAPLAGIDKAFLLRWLRWMEHHGPVGHGPMPQLAAINRQQPTAELRPAAAAQTDETDLMPYEVLDCIERWAIRDKLGPSEVMAYLQRDYPQHPAALRCEWVCRFFRLWSRNQWKRERYAPSFHLDDKSLDPKTWCRFPILSGGFETELQRLETEHGLRGQQ